MKKKNITLFMMILLLTFSMTKVGTLTEREASAAESVTFQDGDYSYSVITEASESTPGSVKLIAYTGNDISLLLPSQVSYEDKNYSVTRIETGAITERPYLMALTIPATIDTIANNAITYNYNLEAIEFLGITPPSMGDGSDTPTILEAKAELIIYAPDQSVDLYRKAMVSKVEYGYFPGSDLYGKGYEYYRIVGSTYNDPQPAMIEDNGVLYQVTKKATATTPGTVTLLGIQVYSTLGDDTRISLSSSVTYYGLDYSVTRLGQNSLRGHNFKAITVPNSVKYLDKNVFDYSIENLILSDNITEISDTLFAKGQSNYNLKYIALPKKLKTMGANAFKYCTSLTTVTFRTTTVPTNVVKALSMNKNKKISVPAAGLSKYKTAFSKQIKAGTIKVSSMSDIENILFSMIP
ncbi:MAG: hypothetical protein K0S01_1368 [Herbinix sp.]|jgi:hypothetical protein|nr:hypothetical protein [Herbinix sp.]